MEINESNLQFTVEMALADNTHVLPSGYINCELQKNIVSLNYKLAEALATFLVNHIYKSKRTKKNSVIIEETNRLEKGKVSRSFHFNNKFKKEFGSFQDGLLSDNSHIIFRDIILRTIESLVLERHHPALKFKIDKCNENTCNVYLNEDDLEIVYQHPYIPYLANSIAKLINDIHSKCRNNIIEITINDEPIMITPFQTIVANYSKVQTDTPLTNKFYIHRDFGKNGDHQFKVQTTDSSSKHLLSNLTDHDENWLTRKARYTDPVKLSVYKVTKTNRGVEMKSFEYKLDKIICDNSVKL